MEPDEREALLRITRSLMLADNLGDVADQIDRLHELLGHPRPQGNHLDGWTEGDWANVEG